MNFLKIVGGGDTPCWLYADKPLMIQLNFFLQLSLQLLAWGSVLVNVFAVTYTQQIRPALNINGTTDEVLSTLAVGFPGTCKNSNLFLQFI